jgi:hypothetical protein
LKKKRQSKKKKKFFAQHRYTYLIVTVCDSDKERIKQKKKLNKIVKLGIVVIAIVMV